MDSAPDSLDCSEKSNDGQNSPPKRKQSESSSGDQGVASSIANAIGILPTITTGKPPSISSLPPVSQQTRHARRIYVGGIPVGYADEEILKSFLNAVISKGLNEENDHSYVLSVYINQKKCFTFVEFKSIELTTACLELDGLIYYSSVLKVLRANEYKPELLPPSHNPPIKLYLPASAFGTPVIGTPQCCCDSPGGSNDLRLDYTFIQIRVVSTVERDAIVLIGFPYDDTVRRATGRAGSSVSPKAIRNIIKKHGAGSLHNPEYDTDMAQLAIFDIGDISPALPFEEAHTRLVSTVAEVVRRGAIPFILGGSSELCAGVAAGLISAVGGIVGVVNVNSQLDVRDQLHSDGRPVRSYRQLLEDPRFCTSRGPSGSSCDGRLVIFGAQGTMSSLDQATYITGKGGRIVWLSKDLRRLPRSFQSSPSSSDIYSTGSPQSSFQRVLGVLGGGSGNIPRRPIYVSINAGVMLSNSCPGSPIASSVGLTTDEILDMTILAGTDPNVAAIDISEIIPELEETRSAKLCVDIFYRFCLGVAIRQAATSGLSELKLGQNVAQFIGSTVPGAPHQSFPPQAQSSGAPTHSNISQNMGGGGFISTAESDRMQAVYHAQQQNLRLHQQQLKQRAVTHPSLLGQFADPVTGLTFTRDVGAGITALHNNRSRHDSLEQPGPTLQRAFEYDSLAQDYQYRESMKALDSSGQRQTIPQDRKYGQYQSQNQGPNYQGQGQSSLSGMAFGQQGQSQGGTQTASASVHDAGGRGSHGHQSQGGVEGFMSPYGFGRSGSGSHLGMQPGHPLQGQSHGLGQAQSRQPPLQQQRQQLQHSLQQQQQAMFAASRGLGGASLNNQGMNRPRTREMSSRPNQQSQEMLSHHGLSSILDFDYDEGHSSGYLGSAISPSRSSQTSSSASVNNDYASDYGSFVSSNSRGYEKVDAMSGLENEDYMVGTGSSRPSYTMHSSPRPSELSLIQQQEVDFEGFEGHMQALRINSPIRSEQQPFFGSLSGGGMGATSTGAGTGSSGGSLDSHFIGRPSTSVQNLDTTTPR